MNIMNKKLVSAAVALALGVGAAVGAFAVSPADSSTAETSLDRFKARVAAIEEKYPEAKNEVVPEIGKNAPIGNGVKQTIVEEDEENPPLEANMEMPKASKIVNLNVSSLRAVSGDDGPILYVADNGRFVISGRLIDVWQQRELKTMEEIENAVSRVQLDAMGYEKGQFSSMTVGNGEKRVVMFIDPNCGWCHRVVQEIMESDDLRNEFKFVFHAVPVLGSVSQPLAKKLWCSVATEEEKVNAYLEGKDAIDNLPAKADCDTDSHDRTIFLSKLIGVQAVPFLIAPDGRSHQGKPADLRAFLQGK